MAKEINKSIVEPGLKQQPNTDLNGNDNSTNADSTSSVSSNKIGETPAKKSSSKKKKQEAKDSKLKKEHAGSIKKLMQPIEKKTSKKKYGKVHFSIEFLY